jgi:hypothetical protein
LNEARIKVLAFLMQSSYNTNRPLAKGGKGGEKMIDVKLLKVKLVEWYLLGKESYCPKSELNISEEMCNEMKARGFVDENEKMTPLGKKYASCWYTEIINKLGEDRGPEFYTWAEAARNYLGLPMLLSSPHLQL